MLKYDFRSWQSFGTNHISGWGRIHRGRVCAEVQIETLIVLRLSLRPAVLDLCTSSPSPQLTATALSRLHVVPSSVLHEPALLTATWTISQTACFASHRKVLEWWKLNIVKETMGVWEKSQKLYFVVLILECGGFYNYKKVENKRNAW